MYNPYDEDVLGNFFVFPDVSHDFGEKILLKNGFESFISRGAMATLE